MTWLFIQSSQVAGFICRIYLSIKKFQIIQVDFIISSVKPWNKFTITKAK